MLTPDAHPHNCLIKDILGLYNLICKNTARKMQLIYDDVMPCIIYLNFSEWDSPMKWFVWLSI